MTTTTDACCTTCATNDIAIAPAPACTLEQSPGEPGTAVAARLPARLAAPKSLAAKGAIATIGVGAACAACCAVPVVATAGLVAVAAPVGILAVVVAALAGTWAWLRRRARRHQV
ncbi:MAG: hypothetical protein V9G20_30340 [Candidatus Promineifilaceae bacterium]